MKGKDLTDQRESDSSSEVSLKILRYLEQNPNAADTVEGILEWWIPQQSICEEEKVVEQALDKLVHRDLLLTTRSPDARKHYCLNTERLEEIRRIIGEAEGIKSATQEV